MQQNSIYSVLNRVISTGSLHYNYGLIWFDAPNLGPLAQSVEQRTFNPVGLINAPEQIPLRTTTNSYFTLRLAPNPLIRVSSHYPLLHPPTNSFWYRIGTELYVSNLGFLRRFSCLGRYSNLGFERHSFVSDLTAIVDKKLKETTVASITKGDQG